MGWAQAPCSPLPSSDGNRDKMAHCDHARVTRDAMPRQHGVIPVDGAQQGLLGRDGDIAGTVTF